MCKKHQPRCSALLELREQATREWERAQTYHEVVVCWGRLGGKVTLHRYGRGHFAEIGRRRPKRQPLPL